jgi:hypothetical protein
MKKKVRNDIQIENVGWIIYGRSNERQLRFIRTLRAPVSTHT